VGRFIYVTSHFEMNLFIMNIANQWAFLLVETLLIWTLLINDQKRLLINTH
jgi:hypothetical protein